MLVHLVDLRVVGRYLVLDVLAALEPATARRPPLFVAPERWLHSIVEQTVTLGEVHDVHFYFPQEGHRGQHAEIKPLQVVTGVCVVANPDVKCVFATLTDLVDVAALEVAVEGQL